MLIRQENFNFRKPLIYQYIKRGNSTDWWPASFGTNFTAVIEYNKTHPFYSTGSERERGLLKWREELVKKSEDVDTETEGEASGGFRRNPLAVYEIPCLTYKLRKWSWTKYVPFLPTFAETKKKGKRKRKNVNDETGV